MCFEGIVINWLCHNMKCERETLLNLYEILPPQGRLRHHAAEATAGGPARKGAQCLRIPR